MKEEDVKRISDAGKMGYAAGVKMRQTVVWSCKDIGSADRFIEMLEEDYPSGDDANTD